MLITHLLAFFLLRTLTYPLIFLSYTQIHALGTVLGHVAYHILPRLRKRTLSNLSLACTLQLDEQEMKRLAKDSFCNLVITCLEYAKFSKEKDISRIAKCQNPEKALTILHEGKGVIFFCGHQANWEILFLEGTSRMRGVAIGRPIKNQPLYNWVLSIRQKFGGKIITPQNAIREGMRALKQGCFLGIVGDQGMPDSGFCSPFLGRDAWTSPLPAILAYRMERPIIVATTKREKGRYLIHYSDPIWPDASQPMDLEISRLMRCSLALFEESVKESPSQWLWQHNRWKQQTPEKLKKRFRYESVAIILPEDPMRFAEMVPQLPLFREIYPYEFITLFVPTRYQNAALSIEAEKRFYSSKKELLVRDYRFKLIFNFSSYDVTRHFRSLSAFEVTTLAKLQRCTNNSSADLSQLLKGCLKNHAS